MQYKIYNFIDARSANYSFDEGTFYFPSMSLSLSLWHMPEKLGIE
jgi:hypothetical protein